MTGSIDELSRALADRYELGPELGRGGMAIVYRARDVRHGRAVAIKVLRPELATSLGPERFLREIDVAARLAHPHILPLLDSGEVNGTLFYVMPFIAGETLRQRLEREAQLPLDEALDLAREIASALDYAHGQGIVHRDIKPENILLQGNEALVADFGLARAVSGAAHTPFTVAGMAVGTPVYMSPEQAAGDQTIDARTDVYSLGCVLYEMIAGVPPFRGATAQTLIAHHLTTPAPSLLADRANCPEAVDIAVRRALEKSPADRFRTAGEFVAAATAGLTTSKGSHPSLRVWTRLRRSRQVMLSVLAGAVATMVGFAFWNTVRARPAARPDLVVVLPFSVNARDSSVANIGIHMMDLLRAALPRAVVRPEWIRVPDDDEKLRLAREQGASMVVVGDITETPQRKIRVSARLVDVRTGRGRTPATAQGAPDDYLLLADTVANRLLGQLAGEQQRTYLFRDQPASAVRAYLDGRIAYRAGRYAEAAALFEQALDSSTVNGNESTFGLAASSLVEASNYLQVRNEAGERGLRLAWKARDQLNPRDRAYLLAEAGPAFPKIATRRATLEAWSRAVEEQQDYPEAFYFFGDLLAQFGPFVQWEGFDQLARTSLSRALKIDSTFVPARQRLAELVLDTGDHATARQLAAQLIDDRTVDLAEFLRWRLAIARNDQGALAELRKGFGTMSDASARRIWLTAQLEGRAVEDAHRALGNMQANAVGPDELASLAAARYLLAMNEGRPRAALEDLYRAFPTDELYYLPVMQGQIIRDAIFGSGVAAAADSAAAQIASVLTDASANRNPTPNDLAAEYVQRCALEQWRLHRGNADSAQATLRRLAAIVPVIDTLRRGGTTTVVIGAQPLCPALLEAWAAHLGKLPDARRSLDRLDSLMMQGPMDLDAAIGNLLVARLRADDGDTTAALQALRRRPRAVAGLIYLAPALRDEGTLAAAVGDREGALRALGHYLALRAAPEASLRAEKDRVGVMHARLQTQAVANRRDTNPVRAK